MSMLELCLLLSSINDADTNINLLNNDKTPSQEAIDRTYAHRYKLVFQAMGVATKLGYEVGVRVDPQDPEWPVCCIMLPEVGEVSWHMPSHKVAFSGYDGAEKSARVKRFIEKQYPK